MTELVTTLIGIVAVAGSGFFGWFFGRRQSTAQAISTEIDNGMKLADYYKKIADDLEPQYQKKYEDLAQMYESKTKILKDEIVLLRRQVKTLRDELKEKDRIITELKKR